jgi:hypothetical protein
MQRLVVFLSVVSAVVDSGNEVLTELETWFSVLFAIAETTLVNQHVSTNF